MESQAPDSSDAEPTYSLGAVVRLTGLSAHLLRAWERRHAAVQPLRTAGGTRRYREHDVERLQRLAAAVAAGHPIRTIAGLSDEELLRRCAPSGEAASINLEPHLAALSRIDREEAERLLGLQLAALGGRRFAVDVAAPLLRQVGDAWRAGSLDVAAEHLASVLIRGLLGSALASHRAPTGAPRVLLATPTGETHEFGALIAAVVAADAGADVTYLGPDLPSDEIAAAAERVDARIVALSIVEMNAEAALQEVVRVRHALPERCALWLGGSISTGLDAVPGVEVITDFAALTRKVALLAA